MKCAIILFALGVASVSAQAQPVAGGYGPVNPFAASNPYAVAFNPYLSGIFGGAIGGTIGGSGVGVSGGVATAPPFAGLSIPVFFQSIVLQREAERLLTQVGFPTDLTERVQDVVADTQEGFAGCQTPGSLPWLQIRCVKPLLTAAKDQLKLIDDEWQARQAAAAASSTVAPSSAAA
ncbi:uncharacterized protein LOC115621218 [Scaptodrosophila lebanonensis]|uniref:Uncharacterized protein LOC115621218 n=1 Tax=Drosophila lebanonensis TaxID=7225 RepID=A0A6J2T180_DROLE|nr:uncharacterized protein LOC115621218 [Scaptodrosophila lebanonensis]